jgi:dipeptidyl aminopeptidase/acylaminoacyl peptidase
VERWLSRDENQTHSRIGRLDPEDPEALAHIRWLTAGPSDTAPWPSPDGRYLAFLARRTGSSQIWLLPRGGGEAFPVTHIRGGVSEYVWLPDGSALIAIAALREARVEEEGEADPDDPRSRYTRDIKIIRRQYHKLDGTGFFDERRKQLVEVSVPDGAVRLLSTADADHTGVAVSPDGCTVAFVANLREDRDARPTPKDLHLLDRASGAVTTVTSGDLDAASPSFSPDGRRVAFFASRPEDQGYGNTSLFVAEEGHVTEWTRALDRPLGDQSASDVAMGGRTTPVFTPDGRVVQALVTREGRVEVWAFDGHGGGAPVLTGARAIVSLTADATGALVGAYSDPVTPSALFMATEQGEQTWIWPVPWESDDVARPVKLSARAALGPPIDVFLVRPSHAALTRHPVVIEVHGGPMSMYAERFFFECQVLVSSGMAVIFSNPRGSVGYGHAFCTAIMGEWGDKDYRDVMAALEAALEADATLDADRVAIAGGSYGGFVVNWAIAHTDRFRAAVSMRSVVNRVSAMGTSDMGWLRMPQYGNARWWEDPEPYWQQSPLRYASAIHTPLLLEHQENDLRLPVEQAEQLFSALKVTGQDVTLVRYPGESHGMSRDGKPWHRVARLEMLVDFLSRHLLSDNGDEPGSSGNDHP